MSATAGASPGLLLRLAGATTLIVMQFAMSGPVLAVSLQQAGHGTTVIGAFAMLPFLMVGTLIPVMPRVLARWGVVRTYRGGVLLELAAAVGYAAGDGLLVWSLCSVVAGTGAAALWNATEVLLAREAPPDKRGRVMGLYQTAIGAALALGPFIPALLGLPARPVLWLAAGLVAACWAMVATLSPHASREPPAQGPAGILHALRHMPALALLACVGGVFEAGLSSVSAAHAATQGLSLAAAASVAGVIGLGSFLCQYPAGWAADHFRPRNVFSTAAALLLATSLALVVAPGWPGILWAAGTVWGGVGGALYTLAMVRVAHVFTGRATAGGAAAMITGYTVGGTLGPPASGALLQWGGLAGLGAALAVLAGVALVAAWRGIDTPLRAANTG